MNNLILCINKDKDITSRDVVNKLCKIFNMNKIGHTGTLDPVATGVLICLTGKYTKLVDYITANDKEYVATIKFGIRTDTLDITGNILEENYNYKINKEIVNDILNSFLGEYSFKVPMYSAVSVDGKRLYEYARCNIKVNTPVRTATIKEIELLSITDDRLKFRCVVSKGTYIRSLIEDICNKLNVIGTMEELVRTRQGSISIDDCYTISDIECNNYKSLELKDILNIKETEMDDILYKKVSNGAILNDNNNNFVLYKYKGNNVALYKYENNVGKLVILF